MSPAWFGEFDSTDSVAWIVTEQRGLVLRVRRGRLGWFVRYLFEAQAWRCRLGEYPSAGSLRHVVSPPSCAVARPPVTIRNTSAGPSGKRPDSDDSAKRFVPRSLRGSGTPTVVLSAAGRAAARVAAPRVRSCLTSGVSIVSWAGSWSPRSRPGNSRPLDTERTGRCPAALSCRLHPPHPLPRRHRPRPLRPLRLLQLLRRLRLLLPRL